MASAVFAAFALSIPHQTVAKPSYSRSLAPIDDDSSLTPASLVRDAPPASVAACESSEFPPEFRAACEAQHDVHKQPKLEHTLSKCTWHAVPEPEGGHMFHARHGPPPHIANEVDLDPSTVSLERCTATAMSGAWEMHRIGPFSTTGGKDWTSIVSCMHMRSLAPIIPYLHNEEEIAALCGNATHTPEWAFGESFFEEGAAATERTLAVHESFLGAVTEVGTLLGYPPVHVHHFHIEERHPRPEAHATGNDGALITHGDDQCLASSGGVGCAIYRTIPGYASLLRLPLAFTADFNDVRIADSPTLTWYALVTIRGTAHDGTLRPYTQVRLVAAPVQHTSGTDFFAAPYLVPANHCRACSGGTECS